MSELEQVLLKIKSISEKDYLLCYKIMTEVYSYNIELESDTLEELLEQLDDNVDMRIKTFSGLCIYDKGEFKKLFTYAQYGWDGGNSISSIPFNLVTLNSNDFGGGPISHIAMLENDNLPGIVFYNSSDFAEIHIFE